MEGIEATSSPAEHEFIHPIESRGEFLLRRTSEILGVDPTEIKFRNLDSYLAGENRFLYGFTPDCFVKVGGISEKTKEPPFEQLKRESLAMQIAAESGFPVIEVNVPFTELGSEQNEALLAIRKLTFEEGLLLASNEQVAAAHSVLGRRVARCLVAVESQIPDNLETGVLKRGDWRSSTPENFRKVWLEEVERVTREEYASKVNELLGEGRMAELVEEGKEAIEKLLLLTLSSEKEYLVHNDLAPNNVFMRNGGEIFFLDWEHAGATHYENLALLTDMTNFWARCWPNPEMQAKFIKTYFKEAVEKQEDPKLTYLMLKTMIIHGSLFLVKYGMAPDHHEHQMSVSLLRNLGANLKVLEDTREELRGEKEVVGSAL